MSTTTKRTTPRATPTVEQLERSAAEATQRAQDARAAADARMRVQLAERGRATERWTGEQMQAHRPHDAIGRLNTAWDLLIDTLGTPGSDHATAWSTFCAVWGEVIPVVRYFEGPPGAPVLASHWDPDPSRGTNCVTFERALSAAMRRLADRVRDQATDTAAAALDAQREQAVNAAVGALPDDAEREPVATFLWPRRVGDSGNGWLNALTVRTDVDATGPDFEYHDSGVLRVYSLHATNVVRGIVANNVPLDHRFAHETTPDVAAAAIAEFDHGLDGSLDRAALGAVNGQSADEAAALGARDREAREIGRLNIRRVEGVGGLSDITPPHAAHLAARDRG